MINDLSQKINKQQQELTDLKIQSTKASVRLTPSPSATQPAPSALDALLDNKLDPFIKSVTHLQRIMLQQSEVWESRFTRLESHFPTEQHHQEESIDVMHSTSTPMDTMPAGKRSHSPDASVTKRHATESGHPLAVEVQTTP